MTDARVAQDGLAVVGDAGPVAHVAQDGLAVVGDPGPVAHVAQDGLAVVGDPGPVAHVAQVGLVLIGRPRILRTPPSSELSGVGYAAILLHTLDIIDLAADQLIDAAGDTLVKQYWT